MIKIRDLISHPIALIIFFFLLGYGLVYILTSIFIYNGIYYSHNNEYKEGILLLFNLIEKVIFYSGIIYTINLILKFVHKTHENKKVSPYIIIYNEMNKYFGYDNFHPNFYISFLFFTLLKRILSLSITSNILLLFFTLIVCILGLPVFSIMLNKIIESRIIKFFYNLSLNCWKKLDVFMINYKEINNSKLRVEILKNIKIENSLLINIINIERENIPKAIALDKLNYELLNEEEIIQLLIFNNRVSSFQQHILEKIPNKKISSFKPENILLLLYNLKTIPVRSLFINKLGIKKIIESMIQLKKFSIIDEWNDYSLLEFIIPHIDLYDRPLKAIFLKMKNPSTGEWHIEGVPPDIKTCKEALSWRIGGIEWNPLEIS